MKLEPGVRLGNYEILAAIGAGGMGEVYRARDLRLGRDVALKVLPPDLAAHPERLARFELEARTVANLNHPNIVTLYSVEEPSARSAARRRSRDAGPTVRFLLADQVVAREVDFAKIDVLDLDHFHRHARIEAQRGLGGFDLARLRLPTPVGRDLDLRLDRDFGAEHLAEGEQSPLGSITRRSDFAPKSWRLNQVAWRASSSWECCSSW